MERVMARDFYQKPVHQRLAQRVLEGLLSTAAVYLVSPQLLNVLAPLQAKLNANALNSGQQPATNGVSVVANAMIAPAALSSTPTVPGNINPLTGMVKL